MFAIIFATGRRLARNKRRYNISSFIILSTAQFAYVFGSDVFCFPLYLSHVCEQEETTTRLFLRRRMCLWNLILSLCPRGKLPLLTVSARKPSCSVGKPLPLADCLLYHWLWTRSFVEMSMRLKLDKRNRTCSFKFESFFSIKYLSIFIMYLYPKKQLVLIFFYILRFIASLLWRYNYGT